MTGRHVADHKVLAPLIIAIDLVMAQIGLIRIEISIGCVDYTVVLQQRDGHALNGRSVTVQNAPGNDAITNKRRHPQQRIAGVKVQVVAFTDFKMDVRPGDLSTMAAETDHLAGCDRLILRDQDLRQVRVQGVELCAAIAKIVGDDHHIPIAFCRVNHPLVFNPAIMVRRPDDDSLGRGAYRLPIRIGHVKAMVDTPLQLWSGRAIRVIKQAGTVGVGIDWPPEIKMIAWIM